jgi:cytochrome c biogenesis protein
VSANVASRASSTYDDFVRLFANVLFAVSLFAVWGVLTLIGVVVDQGKESAAYFAEYPAPLARLILRLGLDNIYHSPQYLGIIGLILVSLAVCTFKRVVPARLPPLRKVKIDAIPLNATVDVRGDEAAVRQRIAGFFKERGWTIRKREFDGEEWMFADRHNWARRGVLVAHLGFVVIATGTTMYWLKGFSGTTAIVTGQSVTIPQTGTRIALDRFSYRYQPVRTKTGLIYQPVDYASTVTVTDGAGTRRETIRVNKPLNVGGTLYYQASYGYAVSFAVSTNGLAVPTEYIKEGEAFPLSGGGATIRFMRFIPTFDPLTGRAGADPRPSNPAILLSEIDGQSNGEAAIPMGKTLPLGEGVTITPMRYTLFSGIQYRNDPGMPLVGIGAFVLLIGLCIAFYFLPARLFVLITGAGSNWRIGIAATTVKGFEIFDERFAELIEAFRASETAPNAPIRALRAETPA